MLTLKILTYLAFSLSLLYFVVGYFSLRHIRRFRHMAIDIDHEHIVVSPFQPSISIVVNCDLRQENIRDKIWKLVTLNYANYDVIILCDSARDEEMFDNLIKTFALKKVLLPVSAIALPMSPRGMYRRGDGVFQPLTVIDKEFFSVDDQIHTGITVSDKDYVLPLGSINDELRAEALGYMAVVAMRDRTDRVFEVRGICRYFLGDTKMESPLLYMSDLTNLRRIYLGGFVLDNNLCRSALMYGRDKSVEVTEFIPVSLMRMHYPATTGTYIRELTPNYSNLSYFGRCFVVSEVLLSGVFLASLIAAVIPWEYSGYFAMLALATYLFILVASIFSIFAAEIYMRDKVNARRTLRLLGISVAESLLFGLLMPFTYLKSVFSPRGASTKL